MLNTLPRPNYSHWTIFYGTTMALLVGWLLFEKMPDGREELAGSVENTFRRSWEVLTQINGELLQSIQDEAEDYPSEQSMDYKNRVEKAWVLASAFEKNIDPKQISPLQASFVGLIDSDVSIQHLTTGFIDTKMMTQCLENYKSLKTSQLLVQSQGLVKVTFDYCATKIFGIKEYFDRMLPAFLPSTLMPAVVGEIFQAEIVMSGFYNPRCTVSSCWVNGQPVSIKERVGAIHTTFPTSGLHPLHIRFRREHCRDGSVMDMSRDFQIRVLQRCDSGPSR